MFQCYVAIGDSLTEGYGDDVLGYETCSWPEHLSKMLQIPTFHNLGQSGLRSEEVIDFQLQQALALKPDLISITAGGNDMLQKKWNKRRFEKNMRHLLDHACQDSRTVLTCTIPDLFVHLKLARWKKFIGRMWLHEYNQLMTKLAHEYQTVHIDFYHHEISADHTIWSQDAVHPNAKGYFEIANAYAHVLQSSCSEQKSTL